MFDIDSSGELVAMPVKISLVVKRRDRFPFALQVVHLYNAKA